MSSQTVCVGIIGDDTSGKTSIILQYTKHIFIEQYVPPMEDWTTVSIPNTSIQLEICDSAYLDDYYSHYTKIINKANYLVICFEVLKTSQTISHLKQWQDRCKTHPQKPILVVATKTDLRSERKAEDCFSLEQVQQIAKSFGAFDYVQCSAKTNTNVSLIFEKIAQHVQQPYTALQQEDKKCIIV